MARLLDEDEEGMILAADEDDEDLGDEDDDSGIIRRHIQVEEEEEEDHYDDEDEIVSSIPDNVDPVDSAVALEIDNTMPKEDDDDDENDDVGGVPRAGGAELGDDPDDVDDIFAECEEDDDDDDEAFRAFALPSSASSTIAKQTAGKNGNSRLLSTRRKKKGVAGAGLGSAGAGGAGGGGGSNDVNSWTNDIDSAAAFDEYMTRLAPPATSRSSTVEELYMQNVPVCLPVVMDMIARRGFEPCVNVCIDCDTLAVVADGVSLLKITSEGGSATDVIGGNGHETEIPLTTEGFFAPSSVKKNRVMIHGAWRPSESAFCLVVFTGPKMCVSAARDLTQITARNPSINTLIIVTGGGATPIANKELMKSCNSFYQVFKCADLLRPFVDHALNPKHRVLSPAEKVVFLKKYMVPDEKKMPLLSVDDPYCKFYGFRCGQVIEIIEELGGTVGTCSTYKLVSIGSE